MHAGAVVAENRLRHEGRGLAVLAGNVLDDVLVPHQVVAHFQQRREAHVDLGLARSGHLVVLLLYGDADPLHRHHHFLADVVLRVGGRHREVALLVARLVAQVRPLIAAAVPDAFG
jgi:hypothetical protein